MDNWQIWSEAAVLISVSALLLPIHILALWRNHRQLKEIAKKRAELVQAVNFTRRRRR